MMQIRIEGKNFKQVRVTMICGHPVIGAVA